MAELCCKHCGSGSFVRNGMAAGHQRYRCKACGRNFTATPARGKPPAMKALAVLLYGLGNLCCKHCGRGTFVRNGMASGHQRYRCKACGRNFTATPARGKPPAMRALAVLLYSLGNVSQGMIAKLLGVSHVAVYKWVRAAGEGTPAPSA